MVKLRQIAQIHLKSNAQFVRPIISKERYDFGNLMGLTMLNLLYRCEENHPVKECLLPSLSQWNTGKFTVSISTIDTLHNRLMDLHGRGTLWKKSTHLPRFIVLDEVHIYEGQAGSHVSNLARRLKVYLKNIKDRNGNVTENKTPPIFVES